MNMRNSFIGELVVGLVLVVLLILLINPFPMYMPSGLEMGLLAGAVVAFAVFGALVWREKVADEREAAHRALAGRIGFLVGALVLTIGVLLQSLAHSLDPWLVLGLGAMILGKLAGLVYGKYRR